MKILDVIYYFRKDRESLYYKQPNGTLMCFPVALYNLHIFKKIKPPKLKKLIRMCKCSKDSGTHTKDLPKTLISELGLTKTNHTNIVLKYGGIIIMKTGIGDVNTYHAVFCYPSSERRNNKRVYSFINFGEERKKIVNLTYDQFEDYVIKGKKNTVKGYCLN